MRDFMNAELENIKNNLKCSHCGSIFQGSNSQARHVKYEKLSVYCSPACRHAMQRSKFAKPIPNRGPCKYCGKEFFSRTAKQYCTLDCYVKSDQFRKLQKEYHGPSDEVRKKMADAQRTGKYAPCLECGREFYQKKPSKGNPARRFCCKSCYRTYFAKRFDRWIANPENIALPQCYDEFLDKEELPCLVDGCGWKGIHLTIHMNEAHGIKAAEFKRAAGFNLNTGVIGKNLARAFQNRELVGVAIEPYPGATLLSMEALSINPIQYKSLEGREHAAKARALKLIDMPYPQRTCIGCGATFHQRTPFGKTLYCSHRCRNKAYYKKKSNLKKNKAGV